VFFCNYNIIENFVGVFAIAIAIKLNSCNWLHSGRQCSFVSRKRNYS